VAQDAAVCLGEVVVDALEREQATDLHGERRICYFGYASPSSFDRDAVFTSQFAVPEGDLAADNHQIDS